MRPITLSVRAFGPYAGEQVFDFGELGDRNLFLIHGPTGAGKTTVLDAICYALYGDTSGAERDGKAMRSDFAAPGELTEVAFDFALGGELYRVHRKPEQERPKLRGEGLTTEPQSATLWRRTGCAKDEEGQVVASRWSDVREDVEELLGLRSEQFRQVVMLPQGRFRELLSAGSKERQEILETLFRTERFRRIERALKDASKDLGQVIERLDQRRSVILEQEGAESLEALDTRRAALAGTVAELDASATTLTAERDAARKRLEKGRHDHEKLQARDRAVAALEALEARSDQVADDRHLLKRAQDAAKLADALSARDEREREAREAADALTKVVAAFEKAEEAHAAAAAALEREITREPEREDARRERTRLDDLVGRIAQLAEAGNALATAERAVVEASHKRDGARSARELINRRLAEAADEREAATAIAVQAEVREREVAELEGRLDRRSHYDDLLRNQAAAHAKLVQAQKGHAAARERWESARAMRDAIQKAWMDAQAAILARSLVDGEPCSVCGATHHPSPATAHHDLPSADELEAAERQVDEAERDVETARHAEDEATRAATELDARVHGLAEELADAAEKELDTLEAEAAEARERQVEAKNAAERVAALDQEIEKANAERSELEANLALAEEALTAARGEAERARAVVTEREAGIPEDLRDPAALEKARAQAATRVQKLEIALARAQSAVTGAQSNLEGARRERNATATAAEKAEERSREARVRFASRLCEAGFVDEKDEADEAAFTAARLPGDEIEALEKEIQTYERDVHAARTDAKRALEAAKDVVAPDLETLEAADREADQALNERIEARARTTEQKRRVEAALADLRSVDEVRARLEERYGVLGYVTDVANGKNASGITFQRYVLGALLDDVLIDASERLRVMSKGRFTLQRARERADLRVAGGLDLEVSDTYTGKTRPVNTLSGGEGFLASLSLALGLADVVQAYAGGVHLDTIFVDEGFGTLDPESLDLAMRALIDLQEGGRLVGIISHVPELRERIDARLEVTAGRRGSTATFVAT